MQLPSILIVENILLFVFILFGRDVLITQCTKTDELLFEAKNKSVERITGDEVSILRELIQNVTGIVSNIFKNYSRRLPPNYPEPVQVRIGLYIKGKY